MKLFFTKILCFHVEYIIGNLMSDQPSNPLSQNLSSFLLASSLHNSHPPAVSLKALVSKETAAE